MVPLFASDLPLSFLPHPDKLTDEASALEEEKEKKAVSVSNWNALL